VTEENREDLRITDVPVDISTKHFRNTILERYRYTNLLGASIVRVQV
jgi:hypothetical protein